MRHGIRLPATVECNNVRRQSAGGGYGCFLPFDYADTAFSPRLGSIQGSLSVDEVETFIDEVAATFPLITKVEELGQSSEKRPLRALCLGACYAPHEQKIPQALFTGMHHAREVIAQFLLERVCLVFSFSRFNLVFHAKNRLAYLHDGRFL